MLHLCNVLPIICVCKWWFRKFLQLWLAWGCHIVGYNSTVYSVTQLHYLLPVTLKYLVTLHICIGFVSVKGCIHFSRRHSIDWKRSKRGIIEFNGLHDVLSWSKVLAWLLIWKTAYHTSSELFAVTSNRSSMKWGKGHQNLEFGLLEI
jgi:hypothetical protein